MTEPKTGEVLHSTKDIRIHIKVSPYTRQQVACLDYAFAEIRRRLDGKAYRWDSRLGNLDDGAIELDT